MKEELGGLSQQIEELRGVCRQLQSELKKFPACSEPCFEAEADALMDSWLDVRTVAADTLMRGELVLSSIRYASRCEQKRLTFAPVRNRKGHKH